MINSTQNYHSLIKKIDDFIRKYYLNKILRGSIYLAAMLFIGYIFLVFIAYYGNFSPVVRTLLVYCYGLSIVCLLVYYMVLPILSYYKLGAIISNETASELIGKHFGQVKDKLLNTLQLKQLSETNVEHVALIEASINQKIAELQPIPFTSAIQLRENRRYLKFVVIPLILILLVLVIAPHILSDGTQRLIYYKQFFAKKAPFQFVVLNSNLSAIQGDNFELKLKLTGDELPQEVYMEDGKNTFKLEKEGISQFNFTFKNIQQAKKIRFIAGEFDSELYNLAVKLKATLLNFQVRLEYPSYLERKNEIVTNSGDLTVPTGTQIKWNLNVKNTHKINFKLNRKLYQISRSNGGQFILPYRAMQDANYSIRPINPQGIGYDSVSYQLKVIPDLSPSIKVTERPDSVNNKLLYFVGQLHDDHGFSKLSFTYKILGNATDEAQSTVVKLIPIEKKTMQSKFFYAWDVNEAKAKPGQQIAYYFEVFDNDGVNGPKASRYASKIFKLPSEKEIDQKLAANSESIKQKMEQAVGKAGEIERDAKRLNRDLLNKKTLNFEEKKQVEQLLQKQKDLEGLVKDIQKNNGQNVFEQNENRAIKQDLVDKQKQIEHLFKNVLNEKTRDLLTNIQKMLDQNNKTQTQEQLTNMQMDNKALQKELDRVLELYKQLELEQKLSDTVDKLEKLAEKQAEQGNKALEKNVDEKDLKQKQNDINNEFEAIKKDLNQLTEKSGFENPEKEQQEIDKQQAQINKELEKKNLKKASDNQKKASSQMNALSKKIKDMGNQRETKENDINAKALREILKNVLTSSFEQEKTMLAIRSRAANDPEYIILTQKQKDIQGNLKMVEDSLYSLSRKVPQVESTVNKEIQSINYNIAKALEALADRRTLEANSNQQYAMTSLNNLALMLNEVLDQLQKNSKNGSKGGSGKDKKKGMSGLSKLQDELNKNMQKARDQMQGQGQKSQGKQQSGMSEEFAKMAQQQQMIRQAMQEIGKEEGGGKAGSGKLQELVKQMEQTETELVNKKIVQESINRQQEILTKLLEAEKSEREKDQDITRESKHGIDKMANYQSILKEYQKFKQQETELFKTVPPSLNSFYKTKVDEYFKLLNGRN